MRAADITSCREGGGHRHGRARQLRWTSTWLPSSVNGGTELGGARGAILAPRESATVADLRGTELAGLEPATSWVRFGRTCSLSFAIVRDRRHPSETPVAGVVAYYATSFSLVDHRLTTRTSEPQMAE
jgi:hypothetical protein